MQVGRPCAHTLDLRMRSHSSRACRWAGRMRARRRAGRVAGSLRGAARPLPPHPGRDCIGLAAGEQPPQAEPSHGARVTACLCLHMGFFGRGGRLVPGAQPARIKPSHGACVTVCKCTHIVQSCKLCVCACVHACMCAELERCQAIVESRRAALRCDSGHTAHWWSHCTPADLPRLVCGLRSIVRL